MDDDEEDGTSQEAITAALGKPPAARTIRILARLEGPSTGRRLAVAE
jgi:hypothetical protein